MEAIIELTIHEAFPHLPEVMRKFLFVEINEPKFSHAGRIDHLATERKIEHLRKGGRVQPFATPSTHVLGF